MKALINGVEIFFDIDGAQYVPGPRGLGRRPVVFCLHGGPGGDHGGFKASLSGLTDRAQIVYIDNRGSGRSGRGDPATYTLEQNVDDVEGLRRCLGFDRIVLLGQSYGGMVAQRYAIKHQSRLSGLILVSTAPSFRFLAQAKRLLNERGTPEQIAMGSKLFAGSFSSAAEVVEFVNLFAPLYSRSHDPAAARERETAHDVAMLGVEALNRGFGDFLREFDLTDELSGIRVPTLVMCGRHDWICPPSQSEEIAGLIPGSWLKVMEDSSHSVLTDERQAALDLIRGFLAYAQEGD